MIPEWLILAQEIVKEREALGRVVKKALKAIQRALENPADQDLFMEAAALNLHAFYAGCERIFESIARRVERSIPSGSQWHVDLLRQMAIDARPARPAVISEGTRASLEEFRGFRHVVRSLYTYDLSHDLIARLIEKLPAAFEALSQDLEQFLVFVREVAQKTP